MKCYIGEKIVLNS